MLAPARGAPGWGRRRVGRGGRGRSSRGVSSSLLGAHIQRPLLCFPPKASGCTWGCTWGPQRTEQKASWPRYSQRYPPTESCSVPVHPVPVSISIRRRPPRAARAPGTGGDTGKRQRRTTASCERQPKHAGVAGSGRGDREWPGKGGGGRRERKNLILSQQRDSARNLEWLKTVKESHGSVELSSLSLATAINSRGIYEIKAPRDGPVSCPHPWHSWLWCLQATVNGDGGYLPPEK